MNGVVLKVRDGKAVVLTDTGDTIEISYNGKRGERVEIPEKEKKIIPMRIIKTVAAVAAAVVIVFTGTGIYSYTTVQACSYVTLDINPSLEYTLNRRDRVITVDALNEEAEPIAEELLSDHIKGKTLTEALQMTTELLEQAGYLSGEENEILVSVVGENEQSVEKLTEEADEALGNEVNVTHDIERASLKDREDAKRNGLSTGVYVKSKEEKTQQVQNITVPTSESDEEMNESTSGTVAVPSVSSEASSSNSSLSGSEAAPTQEFPSSQNSDNREEPSQDGRNNGALPKDELKEGGEGTQEKNPQQSNLPPASQGGQDAPDAGQQAPPAMNDVQPPQQDPGSVMPGNEGNPQAQPGAQEPSGENPTPQMPGPAPGGDAGNPPGQPGR